MKFSDDTRSMGSFLFGAGAGLTVGFVIGAAIVAVIDYRDEKLERFRRIRRDSDENYYYSVD